MDVYALHLFIAKGFICQKAHSYKYGSSRLHCFVDKVSLMTAIFMALPPATPSPLCP